MWQVLNYVQNELLADMSSLWLEVLVIELGIGEDADAKEGDIVLTANKGCRGCLHVFAGGIEVIVEVLDALKLPIPGIAAGNSAINDLSSGVDPAHHVSGVQEMGVSGIVDCLRDESAICGIVGVGAHEFHMAPVSSLFLGSTVGTGIEGLLAQDDIVGFERRVVSASCALADDGSGMKSFNAQGSGGSCIAHADRGYSYHYRNVTVLTIYEAPATQHMFPGLLKGRYEEFCLQSHGSLNHYFRIAGTHLKIAPFGVVKSPLQGPHEACGGLGDALSTSRWT